MNATRQLLVKVQIPMPGNPAGGPAIVYNSDRSVEFHTPVTSEIRKRMKGAFKAFFYANIEGTGAGARLIEIKATAPWQNW